MNAGRGRRPRPAQRPAAAPQRERPASANATAQGGRAQRAAMPCYMVRLDRVLRDRMTADAARRGMSAAAWLRDAIEARLGAAAPPVTLAAWLRAAAQSADPARVQELIGKLPAQHNAPAATAVQGSAPTPPPEENEPF